VSSDQDQSIVFIKNYFSNYYWSFELTETVSSLI